MNISSENSMEVARILLQIKAVKLNAHQPFTWASGRKSPIYCDNRITLSHPTVRTFIRQEFVKWINEHVGPVDIVAGVATGGIAQGALVAQELGLPFIYVRSEAKNHGLGQQIEGEFSAHQSVVIIEDLISTGGSSLKAAKALREADCKVKAMGAIFTYNLEVAQKAFESANVPLFTLTNYNDLLQSALDLGLLSPEEISILTAWRENPEAWSNQHLAEEK